MLSVAGRREKSSLTLTLSFALLLLFANQTFAAEQHAAPKPGGTPAAAAPATPQPHAAQTVGGSPQQRPAAEPPKATPAQPAASQPAATQTGAGKDVKDPTQCKEKDVSILEPLDGFKALAKLAVEKHPKAFEAAIKEHGSQEEVIKRLALKLQKSTGEYKNLKPSHANFKKVAHDLAIDMKITQEDLPEIQQQTNVQVTSTQDPQWLQLWIWIQIQDKQFVEHQNMLRSELKVITPEMIDQVEVDVDICEDETPMPQPQPQPQPEPQPQPQQQPIPQIPNLGLPQPKDQVDVTADIQEEGKKLKPNLKEILRPDKGLLEEPEKKESTPFVPPQTGGESASPHGAMGGGGSHSSPPPRGGGGGFAAGPAPMPLAGGGYGYGGPMPQPMPPWMMMPPSTPGMGMGYIPEPEEDRFCLVCVLGPVTPTPRPEPLSTPFMPFMGGMGMQQMKPGMQVNVRIGNVRQPVPFQQPIVRRPYPQLIPSQWPYQMPNLWNPLVSNRPGSTYQYSPQYPTPLGTPQPTPSPTPTTPRQIPQNQIQQNDFTPLGAI